MPLDRETTLAVGAASAAVGGSLSAQTQTTRPRRAAGRRPGWWPGARRDLGRSPNFSTVAIRLTARPRTARRRCAIRIGDVADEEAEVERCCEQHEEAEDDLLQIQRLLAGRVAAPVAYVRGDQTVSREAGSRGPRGRAAVVAFLASAGHILPVDSYRCRTTTVPASAIRGDPSSPTMTMKTDPRRQGWRNRTGSIGAA